MKKLGLLCFLCLCQTMVFGQNKIVLDSLQKVYQTAKHDTIKIMALTSIAYEYRNSKPDTCITIAEKALADSEKIGFEKGKGLALNTVGAGNLYKRKYADALAYYQKALPLFEKVGDKQGIAGGLNGIGIIYKNQGNYPLALEYYQKSLKINEEIGNKEGIATNLNNIGVVYYTQSNYPLALEYYQKSLKIAEEIGNKQIIASSLGSIGIIYDIQGNYLLALEYHQKGLKINEEIGNKQGIARNLNSIGIVYYTQNNYPLALEYYQKSLKINEEIGNKAQIPYNLTNIGLCYVGLNNQDSGIKYLLDARTILTAIKDKRMIGENARWIANSYLKKQDYNKAKQYATEAIHISQELKDQRNISEASKILFEVYKYEKNYAKALEYHELYKTTNDSLFNVDKSKAIANLEAKAEIDRKEKEIEILNKNKELDQKTKEGLQKDLQVQQVEAARQRDAKLIIEKQAEADRLFGLARQEKDKRKQDSLLNVAQKTQLEADNLKSKEKQVKAEQAQKDIAQEKQRQQFYWIIFSAFSGLVSTFVILFLIFRSRKKIQNAYDKLAISNAETQQAKEEIEVQAEELHKLNHFKDRLFSILAHDLRSPMATLQGTISILDPEILNKSELDMIKNQLTKQFEVTDKILQDLLQWTKDQMKGETTEGKLLNFNEIVNEKLNLFTALAQDKNISLLSELMPDTAIFADENHVNIILQNLLSNALKFTYSGGTITIKSQKIDKMVQISVADTGKGMNEEQQSKLFSTQYFTTKGTAGEKGNGLGLHLVKDLVEKNGGKIWVKSEEGKGTEFCFLLPLT
jgi:two-component system, sensor histidine kinase and response regulator